ncbi:MAG: BLUF domain-containing protein [Planctomycetales bacterium]|nr:BLUF domain-containing protein [Planctomycetales bacterium]
MIQLIYASAATIDFSITDLRQLLKTAREFNESAGITGMLIFHEGSFLQILEGEEHDVVTLYDKIKKDIRHNNIRVLLKSEIDERSFGDWKLGFYDASGAASSADSGFIDFFRKKDNFEESELDRAKKTLMQFREGAWRQRVDT